MTARKTVDLTVDHRFDPKACRHTVNGEAYVLHCHHYATLYCQLADDAELFDGKALLRKSAELAFHPVLAKIFADQDATSAEDRVELARQYWKFVGMGTVEFDRIGPMAAVVRMPSSHVDAGWIKKWGKREKPVNFIGQGFVAAAAAAILGLPAGSFAVSETESLVAGAEASVFMAVRQ